MNEPEDPRKQSSNAAKILTALIVGILLGIGLCGTGTAIGNRFPSAAGFLFFLGVISFWTSLIWLIVGGLKWLFFRRGQKDD